MTEVYEVATFYHHFDVVKEGDARAAGADGARLRFAVLRACRRRRICSRACRRCSAPDVRVMPAPCVGRCQRRRWRWSARIRSTHATAATVAGRRRAGKRSKPAVAPLHRPTRNTAPRAATRRSRDVPSAERDLEGGAEDDGELRPARPGRRRLSRRTQVAHRARRARAAPDGGQHRRRRARHVQGPLLPRARSASLSRRAC